MSNDFTLPWTLITRGIKEYLIVTTAEYSLLATSDSLWETNILLCISNDTPQWGIIYWSILEEWVLDVY